MASEAPEEERPRDAEARSLEARTRRLATIEAARERRPLLVQALDELRKTTFRDFASKADQELLFMQAEAEPLDRFDLNISASVAVMIRDIDGLTPISRIVAELLIDHAYTSPAMERVIAPQLKAQGPRLTSYRWVRRVLALYAPSVLVDGRRLILGLAALDTNLAAVLRSSGAFDVLRQEIDKELARTAPKGQPPLAFGQILSAAGRDAFLLIDLSKDATATASDAPAVEDRLFREPFAESLVRRIRAMRNNQPDLPLALHLDGAWGAGKSTVLGFIAAKLRPWVVVRYNAWQHQRLDPPWWALTNAILDECIRTSLARGRLDRAARTWLRHLVFRVFTGRFLSVVAFVAAAMVGWWLLSSTPTSERVKAFKDIAGVATVLFGLVFAAARFVTGTDKASQEFLNSRPDPMRSLEQHLRHCFRDQGDPIAILIDDVDRCDAGALVKLLEGVQVLFHSIPATFIFAGDRRWIYKSFEKIYADFAGIAPDDARPLGALFVEKTFQISIWIPEVTPDAKRDYWDELLGARPIQASAPAPDISEADEQGLLQASRVIEAGDDKQAKLAFRREAALRLAEPDLERDISQHTLQPLAHMMEGNPRAMKRLVMAYGMARTVDILAGRASSPRVLALWTILSLRWPDLALWLRNDPSRLKLRDPASPLPETDAHLVRLLRTPTVGMVLDGLGDDEGLDEATLLAVVGG
jgi:hypothetical protein